MPEPKCRANGNWRTEWRRQDHKIGGEEGRPVLRSYLPSPDGSDSGASDRDGEEGGQIRSPVDEAGVDIFPQPESENGRSAPSQLCLNQRIACVISSDIVALRTHNGANRPGPFNGLNKRLRSTTPRKPRCRRLWRASKRRCLLRPPNFDLFTSFPLWSSCRSNRNADEADDDARDE
jgi:hypothetical protein